ncbi:MAG: sulfite exporter TauE/SafE family protein [Pseudomonadota bacterium]
MNIVIALPGALFVGFTLGMFGSGGSILTVPILVFLLGLDEKVAITSSLAIVGVVATFASLPYLRSRQVDWRTVILFGGPGVLGSYLGAWSSAYVSGTVQLMTFAIVMLLASFLMLRPIAVTMDQRPGTRRGLHKVMSEGLAAGMLTGFVGVGGGFLIVPALVLLSGLSMQRAVATSLTIIVLQCLVGFVTHVEILQTEGLTLNATIIGFFAIAGVLGSYGGTALATRLPQDRMKQGFGAFLILIATLILLRSTIISL